MEKVNSKDITVILIGMIITIFLTLSLQFKKFNILTKEPNTTYFIILLIPIIIGIVVVIYMKINEINKELNNQKSEQQKLDKRFKTLENLNNIRLDIRGLQKEVFKK